MIEMFNRAGVNARVVHPYPEHLVELEYLIDNDNPVIIPARRRNLVHSSWVKYGKDPNCFAGRSLDEWLEVQRQLGARGNRTFYLDIDRTAVRDLQLARINRNLGISLETDWTPVRQADA